jgi:hypothetical protein
LHQNIHGKPIRVVTSKTTENNNSPHFLKIISINIKKTPFSYHLPTTFGFLFSDELHDKCRSLKVSFFMDTDERKAYSTFLKLNRLKIRE